MKLVFYNDNYEKYIGEELINGVIFNKEYIISKLKEKWRLINLTYSMPSKKKSKITFKFNYNLNNEIDYINVTFNKENRFIPYKPFPNGQTIHIKDKNLSYNFDSKTNHFKSANGSNYSGVLSNNEILVKALQIEQEIALRFNTIIENKLLVKTGM